MKKKKRIWPWVAVVVVVLLAAAIFLLPRLMKPSGLAATGQQYTVYQAEKGDIRVTVHGTGSIDALDSKSATAEAGGKVETLLVENGDTVKKGQLLATIDATELNTQIDSLKEQIVTQDATIASLRVMPATKTLTAPVDSRVKAIYAKVDQNVNVPMAAKGALLLLSTDGNMKVSFVPKDGAALKAGSAVKLVIGGKTVSGFLTTLPDGFTDKAEALITDDSYAEGTEAVVKDAGGAELGRGALESNRPLLVTAYTGTVDHIYVKVGDEIKKGRKLVRLDGAILDPNFEAAVVKRQQLQDDLNQDYADLANYSITAPEDGVVSDLTIQEGSVVQQGMTFCNVQQNSGFKLVVAVDELDIPNIKLGQKANVKIEALPNDAATGEVTKISPIGTKANDVTTYDVTLNVTAPAGALVNMNASADIEVAFKADALLVPIEAIHTVDGKTYVYGSLPYDSEPQATASAAASGSSFPMAGRLGNMFGRQQSGGGANSKLQRPVIEVTVGLINDTYAEILSGVNPGDKIAVPVAQSSSSNLFSFGGGSRTQSGQNGAAQPSGTSGSSGK